MVLSFVLKMHGDVSLAGVTSPIIAESEMVLLSCVLELTCLVFDVWFYTLHNNTTKTMKSESTWLYSSDYNYPSG
jgi:hypothetical protein